MADVTPASPDASVGGTVPGSPSGVRLEVYQRHLPPTVFDVTEGGFLIGSVPGCDLRVPGTSLPPVLALITSQATGPRLRKLLPTVPFLLNGRPAATGTLADGDRLTLGAVEIHVRVATMPSGMLTPRLEPARQSEEEHQAREFEAERARWYRRRDEIEGEWQRRTQSRQEELERSGQELERQETLLSEARQALAAQRAEMESTLRDRLAEYQTNEERLARERETVARDQAQYQADVLRLHRLEVTLEQRQQEVRDREQALTREQAQVDALRQTLEQRARQVEGEEARLKPEREHLARERADLDAALADLARRGTAFETQQALVAALRTRLERLREDLGREAQQLADQRAAQAAAEAALQQSQQETQRLRAELDAEDQARAAERQRFVERSAVMEEALAQFRQVRANLETEEERLRDRARLLNAAADQQAEEASILAAKTSQLLALQQRLAVDRQTVREREMAVVQSEQVRESLQEQLRRRSEELAARQRELTEQAKLHAELTTAVEMRRAEVEHERHRAEADFSQARQELETRAAELAETQRGQAAQADDLQRRQARLQDVGRRFGQARKAFRQVHAQWQTNQQAAEEAQNRCLAELETARREALALQEQLPDFELRAQAAVERLTAAREQLREYLAELHGYARQGREDLEALHAQVQSEAERIHQHELALHRAREDHRLAVAAFRQQLIDWQGQVAEMKRTLAHDETRLERRAAKVEEKTRQIDTVAAQLTQRTEQVAAQERLVGARRTEMERHLDDMREWYRRKLRELASGTVAPSPGVNTPGSPGLAAPRHILPLTADLEPGDQHLGDLLHQSELIDRDTLSQLLAEAQRQRRSLRQLLLAGGYLTLYQMALIETGALDNLILGPVRVIDRLRGTAHETVYRVFDPRSGQEAVLRHLAEADAEDAVRPDEFRQRFAQAALIRHPNVAATLEVLDIAGRPAVIQEALTGIPAPDWPPLTAGSGVWYRLLQQAALGLHAAHEAGVTHGHLHAGLLFLTEDGVLKLTGFGDPPWLRTPPTPARAEDSAADLAALGRLADGWAAFTSGRATKPLAEPLAAVRQRLLADNPESQYPSMAALVEELEGLAPDLPDPGPAWKRFLRAIREQTNQEEESPQAA